MFSYNDLPREDVGVVPYKWGIVRMLGVAVIAGSVMWVGIFYAGFEIYKAVGR